MDIILARPLFSVEAFLFSYSLTAAVLLLWLIATLGIKCTTGGGEKLGDYHCLVT